MSPLLLLAVAIGGGVGALARFLVTHHAPTRWTPWPVLACNVVGSLLAGVASGLVHPIDPDAALVIVTGLCGGLTTFSTFAVEAVELAGSKRRPLAVWSVVGNVVLGVAAAAAGGALGAALSAGVAAA